jgi:hypothetical protein
MPGFLFCLLLAASIPAEAGASLAQPSTDAAPRRLVLALDGIPYDLVVELQAQGHFQQFRPAARMVSTFPSLSEVAFAAIGGGEPPDGYQYTRYDPVNNRMVGTTIASLNGRAHPKIAADSSGDSIPHRVLGYVASGHMAQRDLRQIGREMLDSRKHTFVAYLGTSDPLVHLQGRDGALRFLIALDDYLIELQAQVRQRTGRELLVDIVSDHGSTLVRGRVVPLREELADCGYRRRPRLALPHDVAYPSPGIVGSAALAVADADVDGVARCLVRIEGMDLVAVDRGDAVGVLTAGGEAEIRLVDEATESYEYRSISGDPLGLLDPAESADAGQRLRLSEAEWFARTRNAARPDPLRRLWRAFHGSVKHPAEVLVSLADGYEIGNPALLALSSLRGRFGTHGSMTRMASLGVLLSNWRPVADVDAWGAKDLLFGAPVLAASLQLEAESNPVPPLAGTQ